MKINGFEIIAHHSIDHGIRQDIVILGHRPHVTLGHAQSHEYVVSTVDKPDATSWGQGHYFFNFASAVQCYQDKGGK